MFRWCWHRWGNWEDGDGFDRLTGRSVEIQFRRCTKCNKQQLRRVET